MGLEENPIVCKTVAKNDGNGYVSTVCAAWPALCTLRDSSGAVSKSECQRAGLISYASDRSADVYEGRRVEGNTVPAGWFAISRNGGLESTSGGPAFWIFECAPGTHNEYDSVIRASSGIVGTTNDGALCGVANVRGCTSHEVKELSRCSTCPFGYGARL